jgi:hypothetical protein
VDFRLRVGELPAARGASRSCEQPEGEGRGRGARAIFASGGPRVGAAIDVQESKRSAKRPDSVWHAVVFVGMSGVLHMPTRTRASGATAGSALCVGQQPGNTNVPRGLPKLGAVYRQSRWLL